MKASSIDPPLDNIPVTMKAARGKECGPIDEMLSVQDNILVPRLKAIDPKRAKKQMVMRTQAVALAPGDVRVLSGKTKELQGPPAYPYVPAGDACGIVVELPDEDLDLPFAVGDRVTARFCGKNYDALAEYALISTQVAAKVPDNISSVDAVALASSAAPAKLIADGYVHPGERVLVLGAGGGVGSHLCQFLRQKGVSYLVGVGGTEPKRLVEPPISCDAFVDYTKQDVFSMKEYQENPFDVIIDLAGGGYAQLEACCSAETNLIVKPNSGRFITTVPPTGPTFDIHSIWGLLRTFMFPILWHVVKSRLTRRLPPYSFALALSETRDHLVETLEEAKAGKIKAIVDPKGPFPFTTKGIREAFHLQESRHARGKVVVQVSSEK